MKLVIQILKSAQEIQGMKSLKEFHAFLAKKGFTSNYQHFAKIMNGQIAISKIVVDQFCLALPEYEDQIVVYYCAELFPKQKHLFDLSSLAQKHLQNSIDETIAKKQDVNYNRKSELTQLQISEIAKSKFHYFLFLMMIMARRPLLEKELSDFFEAKQLSTSISKLIQTGVVLKTSQGLEPFNTEVQFPSKSDLNKDFYVLFDKWDEEFARFCQFQPITEKLLLRRISPRYLNLIQSQLQTLIETIKISDESEIKYNTEVIQLNLNLFKGHLPG